MEIIIHQALCGENNKAWDLLKTTMPEIPVAKSIAFKTDLQDQPPSGILWAPSIRGFMLGDHFLLMKTYPDKSPDVRPGRVFSHVLIISKNDLPNIPVISSLLKYFPKDIDKSISIEPISFFANKKNSFEFDSNLQLRFNKAIRAFIHIHEYKNTIIWIGQGNFEDAVSRFWQMLSVTDKESINFGINFNASQIPEGKINFITTPENIESKFSNGGYCIIRKNDTLVLTELSEQLLSGDSSAIQRIDKFREAIEAKLFSRLDIEKIVKGINTFENLESINDLKKLNTLSHIVAEYSPNQNKGTDFKNKLLNRIILLVAEADAKEIPILKIFKIDSFKDGEKDLAKAISDWVERYLFSPSENKKQDLTSLLRNLDESTTANWWSKLIGGKVKTFVSRINVKNTEVILKWIQYDFDIFKNINSDIDDSKQAENWFVYQFPKNFDESNFVDLKKFAIKRSWYKLHAILLKMEYRFELALVEQLKVDIDSDYFEAIEIITNDANPNMIIDFAVSNGDNRLIKISGRVCHNDSTLLTKINVRDSNWQGIWFEAISNGNSIADGIKNPQKEIFKLFDNLVEGNSCNENLMEEISESEFANLLDYPKMELIWLKLPISLKNKFLNRTASALLKSMSEDSTFEVPSDKILSDYIINSEAISAFLYNNRGNFKNALPVFSTFKQLPERRLKDYVSSYTGPLDVIDATQLGKLVSDRRYKSVAYVINDKTFPDNNFKYALSECNSLLGFITRGLILLYGKSSNVNITTDQWWEAFKKLSIKLYSSGPTDSKIWLQAGGEEYDLLTRGTGKELWIHALDKLRNGGCAGITIEKLLKKMIKEHTRNEELKTLKDLKSKI